MALMGILNGIRAEARASTVDPKHPRDPVLSAWFGAPETASGVSITSDNALEISAVYAAVRAIAESVAGLPVFVYERRPDKGRDKAFNHPLFPILHDAPNRWQTPFEFVEMQTAHVVLRGNAYAEILSTPTSAVSELWPLHPDRVLPFRAPDGRIAYRHSPATGPQRILLQHEVLHLRGMGGDGVVGFNPIRLQREALGLAKATEQYGARLFSNDARPRGAIKIPAGLDDEAAKLLVAAWERRHRGLENAHRVAVLDGGMEWEALGMTSEDAEVLGTRGFQLVEIARMFRLPPHKIGILDRATFSNIEQQSIEFVTDTLMPWLARWRQVMQRDLLTDAARKTHFIDFEINALLRGDMKARRDFYASGRQWGYLSANEIRGFENMNPIEGGDVYLSPINMQPSELLAEMIEGQVSDAVARLAPPTPTRPNGKGNGHATS